MGVNGPVCYYRAVTVTTRLFLSFYQCDIKDVSVMLTPILLFTLHKIPCEVK